MSDICFDEAQEAHMPAARKSNRQPKARQAVTFDLRNKPIPSEACAYNDDVKTDVVASIRARAQKMLSKTKWTVIDGFDPKR
jgi:hypothetical protein